MNILRSFFAVATLLVAGAASAQAPLKIGVSAVTAQSLEAAAAEAKKQGLAVQVIEFSDWTTPNAALAAGDLDANFFQHRPFLADAIKARGYKLQTVDVGVLLNIGLFSTRLKRLEDIKPGARISVYDDATNQARALKLLQNLGLIKLRAGAGNFPSVGDIAENPRKLKFVEVPGPQLARALDDVDVAVGAPLFLIAAGKADIAKNALAYSGVEDGDYALYFVARQDNAGDARLKQFIRIYQDSPVVREQIKASFAGDEKLYTLTWLKDQAK